MDKELRPVWLLMSAYVFTALWTVHTISTILVNWELWQGMVQSMPW